MRGKIFPDKKNISITLLKISIYVLVYRENSENERKEVKKEYQNLDKIL